MDRKQCLELANEGKLHPEQLYQYFAMNVPDLYLLYHKGQSGKNPILSKSNRPDGKYVVVFTDPESARKVQVDYPELLELVKEPALPTLLKIYRSDAEGLLFNPGLSSRLFLVKHHLLNMIREYSLHKLSHMPGPWVPTKDGQPLMPYYQKGQKTIGIYTSEKDARRFAKKNNVDTVPVQTPWQSIFQNLQQLQVSVLFLHFSLPEEMLLHPEHLQRLANGPHQGYQELEKQVIPFMEGSTSQPSVDSNQMPAQNAGNMQDPKVEQQVVKEQQVEIEQPQVEEQQAQKEEPQAFQEATTQQENASKAEEKVVPRMDTIPIMDAVTPEMERKFREQQEKKAQEQQAKDSSDTQQEPVAHKEQEISSQQAEQTSEEQSPHVETAKKEESSSSTVEQTKEAHSPQPQQTDQQAEAGEKQAQTSSPKDYSSEEVLANSPSANDPQVLSSLDALEQATIEDQNIGMGWGVCDALTKVRRIWIVMDLHNNMVILAGQQDLPIIDLFTSMKYAQLVIDKTRERNPDLPPMRPQLVSTKKLFRQLSTSYKKAVVWINRDSQIAWRSPKEDTIPYVVQLMRQYGILN